MDTTIPMPSRGNKTAHKAIEKEKTKFRQALETKNALRLVIVQEIVPMVVGFTESQFDDFLMRLSNEMQPLVSQTFAGQALSQEDMKICDEAYQFIQDNATRFHQLASEKLTAALTLEIDTFNIKNAKKRVSKNGELENLDQRDGEVSCAKEQLQHLSQTLEAISAEPLVTLNMLIGQILNRAPIDVAQNPFRPDVFVDVVYQTWKELDPNTESHLFVLRVMQPNILQPNNFLQLSPIYEKINQELIARGIVPDKNLSTINQFIAHRAKKMLSITDRDPYIIEKLRYVFSGKCKLEVLGETTTSTHHNEAIDIADVENKDLQLNQSSNDNESNQETPLFELSSEANSEDKAAIDFQFFEALVDMQKDFSVNFVELDTLRSSIRSTLHQAAASHLPIVEKNKVELLARVFDYIFADQSLRHDIKCLIAPLQFPLLRVALSDEEFFFREDHPARTLINILANSGLVLDQKDQLNDPLLEMMEDVIERVQTEFDEQIDLFSDVVADLEYFLKDEELKAQDAISEPVQVALNEEKMRIAREQAGQDVAIRLETGEVAGFLEKFLQEQWIRILTIAHNVKEEKPHALENALKTMDDLIWSLKPKNSAAERQELITKLPSMLSLLNAWLNAIRWDEPDRVLFFSKLAERHALMARAPLELSPRRQLEIAVNIAQRASNRRLDRFVQKKEVKTDDEAIKQVQALERGVWVDFTKEDTTVSRYKLTWISPKRTSFIFANRQGTETFSISTEDLINLYGQDYAITVLQDAMMDRALVFSLQNLPL